MSIIRALGRFQANLHLKRYLPHQRAVVETLVQRAEGRIEGWSPSKRWVEGVVGLRELGKAILMGMPLAEALDLEIRAARALASLHDEIRDEADAILAKFTKALPTS